VCSDALQVSLRLIVQDTRIDNLPISSDTTFLFDRNRTVNNFSAGNLFYAFALDCDIKELTHFTFTGHGELNPRGEHRLKFGNNIVHQLVDYRMMEDLDVVGCAYGS
jgi:hypothetical protein